MKAIYFDGDNGENVREEEIPDDLKEKAKEQGMQCWKALQCTLTA